jgi:hypothetical protein
MEEAVNFSILLFSDSSLGDGNAHEDISVALFPLALGVKPSHGELHFSLEKQRHFSLYWPWF